MPAPAPSTAASGVPSSLRRETAENKHFPRCPSPGSDDDSDDNNSNGNHGSHHPMTLAWLTELLLPQAGPAGLAQLASSWPSVRALLDRSYAPTCRGAFANTLSVERELFEAVVVAGVDRVGATAALAELLNNYVDWDSAGADGNGYAAVTGRAEAAAYERLFELYFDAVHALYAVDEPATQKADAAVKRVLEELESCRAVVLTMLKRHAMADSGASARGTVARLR